MIIYKYSIIDIVSLIIDEKCELWEDLQISRLTNAREKKFLVIDSLPPFW